MFEPIESSTRPDRPKNTWRTSFEVETENSNCEFQIVRTGISEYTLFLDGVSLGAQLRIPKAYFSAHDIPLPDGSMVTVRALGPFGWSAARNGVKLTRISRSPVAVLTLIFGCLIAGFVGFLFFESRHADLGREFQYARSGDAGAMSAELRKGFDPSDYNAADAQASMTPLHIAAALGHTSIVTTLLDAGVKVDLRTTDGTTPLLFACANDKRETAETLLSRGAKPDIAPSSGEMKGSHPLILASGNKDTDLVRALLTHGADVNAVGAFGTTAATALMMASVVGDLNTATLLVDNGANVNQIPAGGMPPLSAAVQFGNTELVRFLLSKGAIPSLGDAQTAEQKNLPVMAQMLRDADPIKKMRRNEALIRAEMARDGLEILAVQADAQRTGVVDKQRLDEIRARLEKLMGKP